MLAIFCKSEAICFLNLFKTNEVRCQFNRLIYSSCRNISVRKHTSKTAKYISSQSNGCASFRESHQEAYASSGESVKYSANLSSPPNTGADHKLVKVAVIGTPNAGKSTFVNRLVERRVCSISSKVHTTRTKSKAIFNEGTTQIIFLDTPGLVNANESKRHNLEKSFLIDAELSSQEADVIVVIHDVSNNWTRDRLDPKVLRLLYFHQKKPSILVMNKVDVLKSKRRLLDLSQLLTCGSLRMNPQSNTGPVEEKEDQKTQLINGRSYSISEKEVEKIMKEKSGWPFFEAVYMISALTGSGMDEVKEYILQKGISQPWVYQPSVFTDQNHEEIIVQAVQEKLMEHLPQEIPYNIVTQLELLDVSSEGTISAVVLVNCANQRHEKMVIGTHGRKVREIAGAAEHALRATFFEDVKLKIVVQHKK